MSVVFRDEVDSYHSSFILATDFRTTFPYETTELLTFAFLGLFCGLLGSLFVGLQRSIISLYQKSPTMTHFLDRFAYIYPTLLTMFIAILSFPATTGKYYASWLSSEDALNQLFDNTTWASREPDDNWDYLNNWQTEVC